jgi:hypothetical protein
MVSSRPQPPQRRRVELLRPITWRASARHRRRNHLAPRRLRPLRPDRWQPSHPASTHGQQEFDLPTLSPLLPSASPSVRARWSSGRPPSGYSMMRTGDYVLPFALAAIADVLAACPPDRRQEVHMTAGSRTNSSLALAPGECGRQEIFRSPFARLLPAHADPTMVSPAHIPRGCSYESHRARNTRPTPPRRRLPILTPGNLSEVVSAQRNGALMTGK